MTFAFVALSMVWPDRRRWHCCDDDGGWKGWEEGDEERGDDCEAIVAVVDGIETPSKHPLKTNKGNKYRMLQRNANS